MIRHLRFLPIIAAMSATYAQLPMPALRYEAPTNFYKSAVTPPEQYTSTQVAAELEVYPFRSFAGDIGQMFQRTLLREWIDPQFQETSVATRPTFSRDAMPGAQLVLTARFVENGGLPRERMRILVVARGAAAIVDMAANSTMSWQRVGPALQATLASMRVVDETHATPVVEPVAANGGDVSIAGMWVGIKQRYTVNLMGPVGSGSYMPSTHYYLFSSTGRAYRGFDITSVPGGDPTRFDFDAAARNDPDNSGRFTVQRGLLVIFMGGSEPRTITAPYPKDGRLLIDGIAYSRP